MKNPNAAVAGLAGTIATLIIGTAHLLGLELTAEYGAAWATIVVAIVLWFGNRRPEEIK